MTKEFSSIVELKSIREQKSRLSEREQELSSPILTDFSLIPEIYEWFREILSGADCPPNPESVTQRKKFLFIVLFLFAPSVLAGGRLPNGIRAEISGVFPDVCKHSKKCTFYTLRFGCSFAAVNTIKPQLL